MKYIYYWSPFLTKVATTHAVINSAISVKKYSKRYEPIIIDVCGEFEKYDELLKKNKIRRRKLISINYHDYLPKTGFIKSRL